MPIDEEDDSKFDLPKSELSFDPVDPPKQIKKSKLFK